MNTTKMAAGLIAECETERDFLEMVAGLLDCLSEVKERASREMEYLEVLADDDEKADPCEISDFLQDIVYLVEGNT